jgi:hypothetical protein
MILCVYFLFSAAQQDDQSSRIPFRLADVHRATNVSNPALKHSSSETRRGQSTAKDPE